MARLVPADLTRLALAGAHEPRGRRRHESGASAAHPPRCPPLLAPAVIVLARGVETASAAIRRMRLSTRHGDGTYPDPTHWLGAESQARSLAEARVSSMKERAELREAAGLQRQLAAARARLLRELGKYLVSLGHGTGDLNGVLYQQLRREDIASRERLRRVLARLSVDYPEWPEHLLTELDTFDRAVSPNERRGRLIGKELDAAIADPRWVVSEYSN